MVMKGTGLSPEGTRSSSAGDWHSIVRSAALGAVAFKRNIVPSHWLNDWEVADSWIAASENFRVGSLAEATYLVRSDGTAVMAGDFYSDVKAACIDPAERWCVMVGCGLIAYRLTEPFRTYRYPSSNQSWLRGRRVERANGQWWEWRREPPIIAWLGSVEHEHGDRFVVVQFAEGELAKSISPRKYVAHVDHRRVDELADS